LPKDEQTSKHGGGGRYNAILEFKGEQIKNFDEKEKERKKETMFIRKSKKMRVCKNKMNSLVLKSALGISRLQY
jgi:hypothetical protein